MIDLKCLSKAFLKELSVSARTTLLGRTLFQLLTIRLVKKLSEIGENEGFVSLNSCPLVLDLCKVKSDETTL